MALRASLSLNIVLSLPGDHDLLDCTPGSGRGGDSEFLLDEVIGKAKPTVLLAARNYESGAILDRNDFEVLCPGFGR